VISVMDREELRATAAARRNSASAEAVNVAWPCEFCSKEFQTENGFMRHVCRARDRLEELKSPRGQAAYNWYGEWMRAQRRSVPDQERFMNSRQYTYFVKFAEWVEKLAVPNPTQFIKLMIDTGTQPVLWCRDLTYAMYLEWYDNEYPPLTQFIESFDVLRELAVDHGVTLNEIYDVLGYLEIAKLVRRRKLSPWLLVTSSKFLKWVSARPELERSTLTEVINFSAYAQKMQQNLALAKELRSACESENI
jgi:hypothetical protein